MKKLYLFTIALLISVSSFGIIGSVTGPSALCVGATITLSDTTAGGTWSSSNPSVAIPGSSTGIIYGLTIGTATITYTTGTGFVTKPVTVDSSPAPILGSGAICTGASTTLSSATPGGVWTSSFPTLASIGSSSGIVTGIAPGTAVITYSLGAGCNITRMVTVNMMPLPITGPSSICLGGEDTLLEPVTGGTWSSSSTSVASIDFSGMLTGITPGVTTVTYLFTPGCSVSTTVSINPVPYPITGPSTACIGDSVSLSDLMPGGTWASVSPAIASINPLTGVVTAISNDTAIFLYVLPTGCETLFAVYVDPMPGPITGPTFVCAGNMITLADTMTGGKWTSMDTTLGRIDTVTGVLTGVAPGVLTISYSLGATCTMAGTTNITVTPATCSGTPTGGTASATAALRCTGEADTVSLSGASYGCGIQYQWQSSPDGTTFTNISGATTTSYKFIASATATYRCHVNCSSSGLSANSTTTVVTVHNTITDYRVTNIPDTFCSTPDFYVSACGTSPVSNVTIWFGDGTNTNQYLTTTGTSHTDIVHSYTTPGTYTVKEVLYLGTVAQDSVTFSYEYSFCRTLPVKFYFDANSNGLFDTGDHAILLPVTTEIDSAGVPIDTITATGGFYFVAHGPLGTVYTYRVLHTPDGLTVSVPLSGVLTDTIAPLGTTLSSRYFGLNCDTGTSHDVAIHEAGIAGRHTYTGTIIVSNTACPGEAVVVTYRFNPRLHFYSASPYPSTISDSVLTWNLPAVSSSLPSYPSISFSMQSLSIAEWFSPGEIVTSVFSATVASGEVDTTNNLIIVHDTASGAIDPNEISVSPAGTIIPCQQLQYTVLFENTGNAPAHNISIMDTLSDKLDVHTLQAEIASSQMNMSIFKSGPYTIAKFDLPEINLPDSSHHNQCDGMFNIKTKPGLADGTTILNRAGIIFDDNQSVLTNTISNTIGMSTTTGGSIVCYPRQDTLTNNSAGGVWSCTNARATVAGGIVTGLAAGQDTVLYIISNSCGSRVAPKVINVYPLVTPAVTINNLSADTVCRGTSVTLQGVPVNGGTAPGYRWSVNGSGMGSGNTFSYVPSNGDIVKVLLTSNKICTAPDTAGNVRSMHVETPLTPSVSIGKSQSGMVLPGRPVTLTATVTGADFAPTYQWMVNWTYIAGATNATYTSSAFSDKDSVSCYISTGNLCGYVVAGSSAKISVNTTGVPVSENVDADIRILPNPNKGTFTLTGNFGLANEDVWIVITDMVGKEIYRAQYRLNNGMLDEHVVLNGDVPSGMYMLNVTGNGGKKVLRFVVD
jgi:Secretion system C-terminal sorting domain